MYPKALFEVCDPSLPPEWQFVEEGEGGYNIEPRAAGAAGFYEDYFGSDGDVVAQSETRKAVRAMLEAALAWGQEPDRLVLERDLARMQHSNSR